MINKILGWILFISIIIAFLGWLFLGVTEVYVTAICIAVILGIYFFYKNFKLKDFLEDK